MRSVVDRNVVMRRIPVITTIVPPPPENHFGMNVLTRSFQLRNVRRPQNVTPEVLSLSSSETFVVQDEHECYQGMLQHCSLHAGQCSDHNAQTHPEETENTDTCV